MVLAVAAGWWGGTYVQEWRAAGRPQVFYQEYFEPAVMIACGRGFESAAAAPAPVDAFVRQSLDELSCERLPPDTSLKPDSAVYQYAWFYLMWTVGLYWKLAGVSWSGLVPLFGGLFAIVIVLAYAIFRLLAPPWAALPAAAALAISPLHLQNLPHLRDYAKAPFMLALFLILCLIVRGPFSPRRLLALAAGYGVLLGIGYGFRTDLLANILPFVVAVIVFVPGFRLPDLAAKAGAVVLAASIFVGVSWPVISYVTGQGGCQWHAALLGLEHKFNDDLGVTPSYYQWVAPFTDEYVVASVNGHRWRTENEPPARFCSADYDAASGRYLASIVAAFPADLITRAYASIVRISDLPFYLWARPPDARVTRSRLGQWLTYVAGTARVAVLLVLLLLLAVNVRLGLFGTFAVLYFAGYPMLQFAQRHFFHLEFLGWWALAIAVAVGVRLLAWRLASGEPPWPAPPRLLLRRAVAWAAVLAAVVLLPLPIVRAYHDRSANAITGAILAAPRAPAPVTPGATASEIRLAAPATGPAPMAYLDVAVDLTACPNGVALRVEYDKSDPFRDFSATIEPQPRDIVVERYLLPVFPGFLGLSTAPAPGSCLRTIERVESLKELPLAPIMTLPANWRDLPPHQTLARAWGFGS